MELDASEACAFTSNYTLYAIWDEVYSEIDMQYLPWLEGAYDDDESACVWDIDFEEIFDYYTTYTNGELLYTE